LRREAQKKRGRFGVVLLLMLAGLGGYLVFGASDERRVLGVLRELGATLTTQSGDSDTSRQRRVESALLRLASPGIVLEIPELGQTTGAGRIAALLASAEGIPMRLSIEQSSVNLEGARAQATLLVSLSFDSRGEERIEKRTLTAQLSRRGSVFLIETLRVSSRSREQPEARP
jgi:hypothetical protein